MNWYKQYKKIKIAQSKGKAVPSLNELPPYSIIKDDEYTPKEGFGGVEITSDIIDEPTGEFIEDFKIGKINVQKHRSSNSWSLLNFQVNETAQGLGHGSRMLQYIIYKAQEEGIGRLLLEVNSDNDNAIKIYKRFGFKVIDKREFRKEDDYEKDFDVYTMMLEL